MRPVRSQCSSLVTTRILAFWTTLHLLVPYGASLYINLTGSLDETEREITNASWSFKLVPVLATGSLGC